MSLGRQHRNNRLDYLDAESRQIEPGSGHRLRIVLVFPAPYEFGMANLGFHLVYGAFNRIPGICCHRAFAPWPALTVRKTPSMPTPVSLESGQPLTSYDVIAFSLNYENDLLNVPRMIQAAGLRSLHSQRSDRDPWIMAGGVTVTINPEPLADLMDICVLGESEEVLPELCDLLAEHRQDRNPNRVRTMRRLSRIPGLYIPAFYTPEYDAGRFVSVRYTGPESEPILRRRVVGSLDSIPGSTVIHSMKTEFPGLHLVEVSRGCPRQCRFCLIPGCYGPFRHRSVASVVSAAAGAPEHWRIGLLGAGAADHPDLTAICRELARRNNTFSFSSLHATRITEPLAEIIREYGPRTITLAPEAGTDHRRRTLGKTLRNEQLLHAVERIGRPPVKTIKVYFIVGLPGETAADLTAIADLCRRMEDCLRAANRRSKTIPRITAGVSCFVPKALSAFERAPLCSEKTLKKKLHFVVQQLRQIRELRWTVDVPRWAVLQGTLARGDRRLSNWFIRSAQSGADWRECLRETGPDGTIPPDQKIPLKFALPWDHLKVPVYW